MWKGSLERKPLSARDSSLASTKVFKCFDRISDQGINSLTEFFLIMFNLFQALEELSGFIDINKIHEDARPALLEDIKAGEQSIVALAFGTVLCFLFVSGQHYS